MAKKPHEPDILCIKFQELKIKTIGQLFFDQFGRVLACKLKNGRHVVANNTENVTTWIKKFGTENGHIGYSNCVDQVNLEKVYL